MKAAFTNFTKRFITRHPILYYVRFILLSRNLGEENVDNVGRYDLTNDISEIPQIFKDNNDKLGLLQTDTALEKVRKIANFLRIHSKAGPAISLSSGRTLELLLAGKGGVCNDYSMVFNVFCLLNNIPSKEWNCVDKFYKVNYGHTFNEIYCSHNNKWIAIDIGKMVYFTDVDKKTPLSALELFTGLRAGKPLNFKELSNECPPNLDRLTSVFSDAAIPYITSNYKAAQADHYLDKFRALPLFVIGAIVVLLRKNYSFVFVIDDYKEKLLPALKID